jgi:hypothetical protein
MNRLELAAQAPNVPDWYLKEKIEHLILSFEEFSNSELVCKEILGFCGIDQQYHNYKAKFKTDLKTKSQIDFDWRFYWADEMLKRNEQEFLIKKD